MCVEYILLIVKGQIFFYSINSNKAIPFNAKFFIDFSFWAAVCEIESI